MNDVVCQLKLAYVFEEHYQSYYPCECKMVSADHLASTVDRISTYRPRSVGISIDPIIDVPLLGPVTKITNGARHCCCHIFVNSGI